MPSTALNRTTAALLTNKSGGALVYGDVVVLDNTNANGFTTTTTGALSTRGIGVILEPAGIGNNASGMVALGGWVPKINLNTAATVGQYLKTHTVAGQATPHSSPQVEGDFAIALSASATPAAILFGSANGPSVASGDVVGPASSTNNGFVKFDGTTGKLVKDSVPTIALASEVSGDLPFANLTQGSALSVLGVAGNATADHASIAAGSDHQVLRRSGAAVAFGAVNLAQSAAVTGVLPGANGGGLVLVQQLTASSSASLDFASAISSTYDEYVIEFVNIVPATDNTTLYMRMSTDGGSSYDAGANYSFDRFAWRSGGSGVGGGTAQAQIQISHAGIDNAATSSLVGSIRLFSPGSTTDWKKIMGQVYFRDNTPDRVGVQISGAYESTTAVNAFQFLMSSGNIASGTIRVYGMAK